MRYNEYLTPDYTVIKAEPARSPTLGNRLMATLDSHWQDNGLQYSENLAYYATLVGVSDRSRSAVDDVTIIDHFV